MPESILVVDDHPLYRDALVQVLRNAFAQRELLVAGSSTEGLKSAESAGDLRLVLLDLGLPGVSGIEAVSAFRRACPDAVMVVVSASEERREVVAAFAAGAAAFVSKAAPSQSLVELLQRVLDGQPVDAEWVTATGVESVLADQSPDLTPRQRDILLLLCEGHSNKEIGLRLGLAEVTVKMHVSAIFRVFGVSNRTQAVVAARHAGFYAPATTPPDKR